MASHNMAADLSYTYIGGNQYRFTLTVYRDCSGIPASTNWWLYISSPTCGVNTSIMLSQVAGPAGPSGTNVSQLCGTATSTCNGGTNPGVQVYYYEGVYTITCQAADWRFYAEECCRNPATNLNGADSYDLYVQATLNNTGPGGAAANANNSPSFTNLPVPYVCAGQPVSYSNNSVEPDGDVLVYTLIQPLHDAAGTVPYNAGFSATNPLNTSTGFTFNTTTGQMTFTPTAGQNQVAVVSMRVDEYRNGVLIGSTMRDIQFIVRTGCTNNSPASGGVASVVGATVNSPFAISACSGNNVSFNFPVSDPDGNNITVSALGLASLPGTPNFVVTNNNTPNPGVSFNWAVPGTANGLYTFSIRVQDNGCPIIGVNVYTISINLTGTVISNPGPVVCGIPVTVTATGAGPFTWSPMTGVTLNVANGTNVTLNPATSTTYTVTNACGQTTLVPVTVTPGYNMDVVANTTSLCLGSSVQIQAIPDAPGTYTYNWTPATNLSCTNCANPVATPTTNTTYSCTVTNSNGCQRTDNISLTVTPIPAPTISAAASSNTVCAGQTVNLTSSVVPACNLPYSVSTITHNATGGGGWTTVSLGDDAASAAQNIGFTFRFYCNNYTQFFISSNGYITFGSGSSTISQGAAIPNTGTPNNFIALYMADLNPASTATRLRYKTLGTAPNRVLVMNFNGVPFYSGGGSVEGFIYLYETTNVIEVHATNITANSYSGIMGIENSNGDGGNSVTGYNYQNFTASNLAWRFTPPSSGPYTYAWSSTPAGLSATTQNTSHAPAVATSYNVTVTDQATGCQTAQAVNVQVRNVDAGPDLSVCAGGSVQLNATLLGPVSGVTACGAVAAPTGTATQYTAGTGTLTTSYPYLGFWHDGRTQMLFTAAELTALGMTPGTITQLAFNVQSKASTIAYSGLNIRLGCTALTALGTTFQTGLTTVFTGNVSTATGINNYVFTTPFGWDGTSNLIVELCFDNTSYTNYDYVFASTTAFTSVLYNYTDGATGCTLTGSITSTTRPNIRFTHVPAQPTISWTPAATLTGATTLTPTATPTATTNYTVTVNYGSCSVSDVVQVVYGVNPALVTWTGATNNNWFTNTNWTPSCVPTCGTNVIIPNVATTPVINTAGQTAFAQNVTVNTGSRLQIGNGRQMDVCGHFVSNQTAGFGTAAGAGTGTIRFVGTANQNFTLTNAATVDMPNVVINNGQTVTLLTNMNIDAGDILQFGASGGRIITDANEVFVRNNAATGVVGHSATGYVQGNLRRAVVGSRAFDFPVGDAAHGYQLANINFTSASVGATANLRAFFSSYATTPSVAFTACTEPYTCVYPGHGKWTIDPNVVGTYTYTASFWPLNYGASTCGAPIRYTVMKRPSGAGAWALEGTAACPYPGTLAGISRTGLTTFSEFAPVGHEIVLPVEFLNLSATPMTDFIQVAWNVASESNTNYYQVERSTDQQHFASVGSVMATGTMAYGLPDHDVVPGTRYFYRVRAVDADGLTTLSNTVEAILAADGTVMYNVFPNPTSAGFNVVYNTSLNGPMSLELFDATGRLVYQQRTEMQAGSHTLVVPAQALSAGVYNLRLTSPAGTEVVRVVRN